MTLDELVAQVEKELEGTDHHWLLRQDATRGYLANIVPPLAFIDRAHYHRYASTPIEALQASLAAFKASIQANGNNERN